MLNATAVACYHDGLVGVVTWDEYLLVRPKRLLVAAGAREKALAFPGCDLPGVYGAGAFQTLVNRDLVKPLGEALHPRRRQRRPDRCLSRDSGRHRCGGPG